VVALADYLVTLKDSSGILTHQQATQIIVLWKTLSEYDRQPIAFFSALSTKMVQGRFKATKKSTVVPGVESTKRMLPQKVMTPQ